MTSGERESSPDESDFALLERLRRLARQTDLDQLASLNYFRWNVGFQHVKGRNKISVSSTATCVLSLVAAGRWAAGRADTQKLIRVLLAKNTSAELPKNNPFTIAWILDAVTALERLHINCLTKRDRRAVDAKVDILRAVIKKGRGGVSIAPYPASAYLTQLAVRVLRQRGKLTTTLEKLVTDWAWAELPRQLALIYADSKTLDPYAVAYLLMLVTGITPRSKINPEQASILRAALAAVFGSQLEDGTWPASRPLFHYPNFGNAYCYEYEMLAQLLGEPGLQDMLLNYLPQLGIAAESVSRSVYRVEGGIAAWTSGHHPQQGEPESWATASVYHFMHQLDRLLAEAVRRTLFRYLGAALPPTQPPAKQRYKDFAPDFLDCSIQLKDGRRLLKKFIWESFVQPLARVADNISEGRKLAAGTPRSAIFFGPPGTSKTDLSRKIADFLGWPLLSIDPSYLLRKGMDEIQGEANTIFRMLEEAERVVVLFDEFDELVRERGPDSEPFSRLLTTAMLPKLADIYGRAAIVFVIATNHIAEFDLAIRRQGRFDKVIQIMPPTYAAKVRKPDWGRNKNVELRAKFAALQMSVTPQIRRRIADLTFGECNDFATALENATTAARAIAILEDRWTNCILQTPISSKPEDRAVTWAVLSGKDAVQIR